MKFTHGDMLRNTVANARAYSRLIFFYIIKLFYPTFKNDKNLCYPMSLLSENDTVFAIPAVDSGHLRIRKFVSNFRTLLISLAIRSFHEN